MEFIEKVLSSITPTIFFPVFTVFCLLLFFFYYIRVLHSHQGTYEWITVEVTRTKLTIMAPRYPLGKSDIVPMAIITVVFSFLALFMLDGIDASQDFFQISSAQGETLSASVSEFIMLPSDWQVIAAIFSVVMLIVLYVFIKNLFGRTAVAILGTLLLGFDFMRFAQTRIDTLGAFSVFFILLSFYFMYRHVTTDAEAPLLSSVVPLALSGAFFGFGLASKWVVLYAGIGLGVIYVIRLIQLYFKYRMNRWHGYCVFLAKTLLYTVLSFGVLPVIILCLSYIPYASSQGMSFSGGMLFDIGFYRLISDNLSSTILNYGRLVTEHPYSSQWWEWIFNVRPILYFNSFDGSMRSSIATFGNPLVWWGGIIAMLAMVFRVAVLRDGKAMLILIGYLSQLLPWVIEPRTTFIYHYFPATLFLALALAHVFNTLYEYKSAIYRVAVYGFTAFAGALFVLFYPALTGVFVPEWYFNNLLRWFPGLWPF